ncbi:MAG: prepilin-type N-terminal cleavage/methylation domain-containing protein [Parcubacteria group bacterium]|nr:prepilin-type N-terminal cleavage/methylation domain-containing protein [Parcubacteria group bacterium]
MASGNTKLLQATSYKLKAQKGFSLIEALVAISVLVLSLTGTMTVASRGLFSSDVARDQIVAFYLAQEAVEFVRNVRDNNALGDVDWLTRLDPTCTSTDCRIDVNATPPNDIVSCGAACPVLRLSSNDIFNYGSGTDTVFRRTVRINETVADREATIDVTIAWDRRGHERNFTIREHIFHWK